MGKKSIDVDKAIVTTRAIPGLASVADLAEIGRAVCEAIRAHGGLPRVRHPRVKADGKARPTRRGRGGPYVCSGSDSHLPACSGTCGVMQTVAR